LAKTDTNHHKKDHRKLQVTGGSTYILSLPKDWVTRNQLKKGSTIMIREEDDGVLSILPPQNVRKEKTEAFIKVAANDLPETIMRKVISAYVVGYNLLHLKPRNQQQLPTKLRNQLKNFTRNYLVGTEIATDAPTDLILQVLLNYPELSVQSALSRMAIIAASMHKEAITALKNLDYSAAKAVVETDREVNRFGLYIIRLLKMAISTPRIIKEVGLNNPRNCLGYRLISKSVERTADHATKIAENVLLLREPLNKELVERIDKLSNLAISMFEEAVQALFKCDYDRAESVIEKIVQVRRLEKEAILSSKDVNIEEVAITRLLIESVRRTAEYASDISEVVLNLSVETILS